MQVRAVDQGDELGVVEVVCPSEPNKALQGFAWRKVVKLQFLFGVANVQVSFHENRAKQVLLATEVVVDHALVGASLPGDLVHARAGKAKSRKFRFCGGENPCPGCVCVAGPRLFLHNSHVRSFTSRDRVTCHL